MISSIDTLYKHYYKQKVHIEPARLMYRILPYIAGYKQNFIIFGINRERIGQFKEKFLPVILP